MRYEIAWFFPSNKCEGIVSLMYVRALKCLKFVLLIASLLGTGVVVWAQSVVNFPRLVDPTGRFTGIAIANASNHSATLTVQVYDDSGALISSAGIPKSQVKMVPGGQVAELDSQFLQLPAGFHGWAQIVSSDNSNLQGLYLIGDSAGTFLDGADSPSPLREQILPLLSNDGTTDTEINIVNPTSSTAFASLQTIALDGTVAPVGAPLLTLQPHGLLRVNTKSLGFRNYSSGSYLSINSNVGLLAMELVESQSQPLLACLNGVDVNAAASSFTIPHAVVGGDYFSVLGVINLLNIPQTVSIALYQPDGQLLNTGAVPNPLTIHLNPNATLRSSLADLFQLNSSIDTLMSGWVSVTSNFGPITGYMVFGNAASSDVAAVPSQAQPATELLFPHLAAQSLGYFTGVALLNPNTVTANVKLSVINPTGVTVAVTQLQLNPNQKLAEVLADLLPSVKDQQGGSMVVTSDQPLFGMELIGSNNLKVLANVPVEEISSSYTPPDLGKFVLSGVVTSDTGSPLSGAAVNLSGSIAGATVATDDQGQYVFLNVPSGNYAVEPTLKNFEFAPTALSVAISATSVGDADFTGTHLPSLSITALSPPNGPVGSPVTLFGTGFSTNADDNIVHFFGTFSQAVVLKSPPPTDSQITVLVPAQARTGPVVVGVGNVVSNPSQFSVTESNAVTLPFTAAQPSSVAISGLGNLALVGHRESGTISLVGLTPNPVSIQDLTFSSKSVKTEILAVATDDDGRGGGTSRDDNIGFFNIEAVAFKALQTKIARFGAKLNMPEPSSSAVSGVNYVQLPAGSEPVSLAFEPFGRFAMTANEGTDSLSFVEFPDPSPPVLRGTLNLPSGSKPVSVSVAANGVRALVANSGTNSVSVVEFAPTAQGFLSGQLLPVITRDFLLNSTPNAVAINLDASVGITANADNTASILDLNGPADASAITTIALPKFSPGPPSAVSVSMAPNGTYAIVTSRDSDGNAYLNVVTLAGVPEVSFVQVLPKTSGTSAVAIAPDSSTFVVANPLISNVAVFTSSPGAISLQTLSLSRAQVKQSVTLFGTGFSANPQDNVVRFQGQDQITIPAPVLSVVKSNQITVEVPVGAVPGPVTVSVGRTSSNQQFFVVLPDSTSTGVPAITSVQPATLNRTQVNVLTIGGSGFTAQSVVEVDLGDGNGLQPLLSVFGTSSVIFVGSTKIQVLIPGGDLSAVNTQFTLDIFNPGANGGRSNGVVVYVSGQSGGGGSQRTSSP